MTKPPDLEALARRYVELWQDQLAASAADPEITDAASRALQAIGSGAVNSALIWQNLWTAALAGLDASSKHGSATPEHSADDDGKKTEPSPVGATPAAAAPAGGEPDVAKLEARLALLEERLAALEPRPGRPSGRAAPRSGRRSAR